MDLESVEQKFFAQMSDFLDGLDLGIEKAAAFADACKAAEDAVVSMAGAANDAAVAMAADFGVMAAGADKVRDAVAGAGAAVAALSDKHVDISASVTGISGPVAGAVAQVEALKAAMAGLDDRTVTIAADMRGAGTAMTVAAAGGRLGLGGWLTLGNVFTVVHLAAAVLGAQIVADAIGITAFGLAASGAVGPAVSAASSVSNLTTQYAALDNNQKAAALSVKAFTDSLQIADETGIFGVFYQGLNLVQSELGKGSGIVTQATNAFGDFFGMLKADLGSKAWANLLSGTTGIIRTDLDALFRLINAGIGVIPGLFHNLNFLGTGFLDVATGTLHAVAAVTEWNPALTRAAALAGVGYGAYKLLWAGLGPGPGILQRAATGLAGFGTRVATASTYMSEGAGVAASYGLGIGAISGTALLATGAVAALAAGVAVFALAEHHAADATQVHIAALRAADQATGNNVAGYEAMDAALRQNIRSLSTAGQVTTATGSLYARIGSTLSAARLSTDELTAALQGNEQVLGIINTNALNLGTTLGLTTHQVKAFANATGVDLSTALKVGGTQFTIDAGKIQGYAQAVALSHDPLSQFKVDAQQASNTANSLADQVKALAAAYSALVTPTLNVIAGQVQMKNDQLAASQAIAAASGQVGLQTAAARAAAQAIVQAANDAISLSENIKQQTGSTQAAIAPLQNFASWLESAGAKGAYVRQILAEIKSAEDALYSKSITITTNFAQTGAPPPISGTTAHAFGAVKMAGGGAARPGPALVGEEGPELMWMRGGEQILPAAPTAALMHLARAAPGVHAYAGGTTEFTRLLHLLERDFRLIENGLRINLKRPEGVWFPSLIKAVEEIRRDFARHLISKRQELELLRLAERRNRRLEGIAVRHAESRDLSALAALFAPARHARPMFGPIAALIRDVEKERGAGVISGREETRLTRLLRHDNAELEKLARHRAYVTARLHAAEADYLAKVRQERQYAASVSQAAASSASLSTIMSGATGPVSSSFLLASMRIDLAQIRKFDADIKKLEKLGLDRNLLNQIIQMGPQAGDQAAQALISGPLSNIKALNATEAKVQQASGALGKSTSRYMYQAGVDAARGLVKGLEHEKKAIEALMERIARDMVRTLRRELKIHSPSELTREIGRNLLDGIPLGVRDRMPSLDSSLRSAAGHVSSALSTAAGVSAGGAMTVHIHNEITWPTNRQLYNGVQTQSLRVSRRNADNRLTVTRGRGG